MTPITLCADDYALHPAINAGVLQLAAMGRLNATSCMSTAPGWPEAARPLREMADDSSVQLRTGLHFNLTEGHGAPHPTSVASLPQILLRAYSGQLRAPEIAEQLARQLDAYERAMHAAPQFIDGHQHVHQLPVIRNVMLQTLVQRYGARTMPAVRNTVPAASRWLLGKPGVLALLGGWRLRRMLQNHGIPHNQGFGGVYGFDAATPEAYGQHMGRWLAACQPGALLMCHPAAQPVPDDAIGAQRTVEFAYLRSDAFADVLQRHGVQLTQEPSTVR